jgi:NADP-dependent 3-hydroxy acid dehydrogenase YdfG
LAGGVAEKLLAAGNRVIGLSRKNPNRGEVEFYEMDLADEDSIENAVKAFLPTLDNSPIYLLNVAGTMQKNEITKGETERVYRANILGEIYLTSLLIDKIKETDGDILNVSSTIGTRGVPTEPIYSSSKWAVRGFTKSLQEQLKNTKVRVTDFAIGGFVSDLAKKIGKPGFDDPSVKIGEWIPTNDAVNLLYAVINMPKTIQISEIIADRKAH